MRISRGGPPTTEGGTGHSTPPRARQEFPELRNNSHAKDGGVSLKTDADTVDRGTGQPGEAGRAGKLTR